MLLNRYNYISPSLFPSFSFIPSCSFHLRFRFFFVRVTERRFFCNAFGGAESGLGGRRSCALVTRDSAL